MSNTGRNPNPVALRFLLAALLCVAARGALAVPITDYITVQPIDVCSATVCAAINNLPIAGTRTIGQTALSNPGTVQIGAIDTSTGINITNAILNQIGVAVAFNPVVKFQNTNSATYLNLNDIVFDTNPTDPAGSLTSATFLALSDQPTIKNTPAGSSVSTPSLIGAPVSSNPSTINMFFVGGITPEASPAGPGGSLYGFSWVGNNGIAISSAGAALHPDTLAHEIGHDLGLPHFDTTAGENPCSTSCVDNLMTAGTLRNSPTTTSGVLTAIKQSPATADGITQSQANAVLDPSSALNPIPLVSTQIAPLRIGESSNPFPFSVNYGQQGRPGEFLKKLTLTAPGGGVFFRDNTFALPGGSAFAGSVTGTVMCTIDGCPEGTGNELVITFTNGAFTDGGALSYNVDVCENTDGCISTNRPDLALDGGTYAYQFQTDDAMGDPIEQFLTTSDLTGGGDLFSDSQTPDPTIPPQILDPSTFVGFDTSPCLTGGPCGNLFSDNADDDVAVPEPPAILILLTGLGITFLVRFLSPRHRGADPLGRPQAGALGGYSSPALRSPSRISSTAAALLNNRRASVSQPAMPVSRSSL
jgi:hypothetical protein